MAYDKTQLACIRKTLQEQIDRVEMIMYTQPRPIGNTDERIEVVWQSLLHTKAVLESTLKETQELLKTTL
jgi:hypothetical protein